MPPVDQQSPGNFSSSSSQAKMEDSTTETSVETDTRYLLSPSTILIGTARNATRNTVTSNENHGLVGIAPPTWENKGRLDGNYSTSSSGTHSTRITAKRKSLRSDLLNIANPDEFMDLSNPNDDLLNISLDLFEDFYDRRDDSSITLPSIDDILPSRANHYSVLHTILSGEESDARYESESTKQSILDSSGYNSDSGTDDSSEDQQGNLVHDQSSPHSGSSRSTPPMDRFGLPLLPFSHELFKKLRVRKRIVDQQLKEQDEQQRQREPIPHASAAEELTIREEKKEEETTVEVDQLTHLWFDKLMIEFKSGTSGSSTLQFPGQRAKGRTTDKDSSNKPTLPSRRESHRIQNGYLPSPWILLYAPSRKLMMIRSRSVPILSFFGAPPGTNSPRGISSRNEIFQQFVEDCKDHVEQIATPEESYCKRSSDRKRSPSQDLIENRYHDVRSRALFQLEESKRRLQEYKRANA